MSETNVTRQTVEKESEAVLISDIRGETVSLEELARQQGVSPIQDINEIVALWPADDDSEELFHFIISERAARRKLSQEKNSIS